VMAMSVNRRIERNLSNVMGQRDPEAMIRVRSTDPIRASGLVPRQQAGHMTASDLTRQNAKKTHASWGPSTHDGEREASPSHRPLVVRRETGKEQEVQVRYDEDMASHIAPKPCVVSREGRGEASAGDHAGWPLSRERALSRMPTGLPTWKATRLVASSRAAGRSGVVRDPSMRGHSLSGNREISSLAGAVARRRSAWGRCQSRSPR
jgi:hypothetical protein